MPQAYSDRSRENEPTARGLPRRFPVNEKHTPGPLRVRIAGNGLDRDIVHDSPDGLRSIVARLFDAALCPEHGTIEANAFMFAAAPEMYEALREMLADGDEISVSTKRAAREAVAKAEGRAS